MKSCMESLSDFLRNSLLSIDELKNGIKFLAVMQQGDHELFNIAMKLYDLDLALVTAQALDMDPKEYLENLAHRDQKS